MGIIVEIGMVVAVALHGGPKLPALVAGVEGETLNLVAFREDGTQLVLTGIKPKDGAKEGWPYWEFPGSENHSIALLGAPLEPYGGFNLLSLLGGDFASLAGPLLVLLYQANKGRIESGSDRLMTPPIAAIEFMLDRLGITADDDRLEVTHAVKEWGDKGGDVLVKIAAAKAGGI